jgi:hypothetical protein
MVFTAWRRSLYPEDIIEYLYIPVPENLYAGTNLRFKGVFEDP